MINDSYKVEFRMFGGFHIYGYADTLSEALALDEKCKAEGWLYRKISHYDEDSGNWIVLQET